MNKINIHKIYYYWVIYLLKNINFGPNYINFKSKHLSFYEYMFRICDDFDKIFNLI